MLHSAAGAAVDRASAAAAFRAQRGLCSFSRSRPARSSGRRFRRCRRDHHWLRSAQRKASNVGISVTSLPAVLAARANSSTPDRLLAAETHRERPVGFTSCDAAQRQHTGLWSRWQDPARTLSRPCAGIGGLSCACLLARYGLKPLVLESHSIPGARTACVLGNKSVKLQRISSLRSKSAKPSCAPIRPPRRRLRALVRAAIGGGNLRLRQRSLALGGNVVTKREPIAPGADWTIGERGGRRLDHRGTGRAVPFVSVVVDGWGSHCPRAGVGEHRFHVAL